MCGKCCEGYKKGKKGKKKHCKQFRQEIGFVFHKKSSNLK
jgi:hypothetical protein